MAGILLLSGFIYVLIPNIIVLKANVGIKAAGAAIHRRLLDKDNMAEWWPGKMINDSFYFNDFAYKIDKGNITVVPVSIDGDNTVLITSLFLTSIITDSTQLRWVGSVTTPYNPVKRLFTYLKAKKINRDMTAILQKMENFYSKPKNIYGIDIKKTTVVDSLLIVTSANSRGYPAAQVIYNLVNKLKKYAGSNGAKQNGYPMLNISTADSMNFNVKVAIPTDKIIPSSGDILQKSMPGGCIILYTEVKGGISITTNAFEQMRNYAEDHQLKAPAIPFYSLVTDRVQEPDTSKWITKIYFPAMIYPE